MNNLQINHTPVREIPVEKDLPNEYLLFKLNTTGLPKRWYAPVTDIDNWPRMVQLAWIVIDNQGNVAEEGDYIIKPEGFEIPFQAFRIHGITTASAIDEGVNLTTALSIFNGLLNRSKNIVAYNLNFDQKVLGAEYIRMEIPTTLFHKKKVNIMERAVSFCRLPGLIDYKYPKLTELYQKLFHKNYRLTHDALLDLRATEKCFREMLKQDLI